MVDFRLRDEISFRHRDKDTRVKLSTNGTFGLGNNNWQYSLGFDLEGLYPHLALPHQMRHPEQHLYTPLKDGDELIWIVKSTDIPDYYTEHTTNIVFNREIDLANVVSANLVVELVWAPYEFDNWLVSVFTNIVSFGIGFIPVVGSLMSIGFTITVTAITDQEYFSSSDVLEFGPNIINAILNSGKGSRKYTQPGLHFADPGSGSSEASSAPKGEGRKKRSTALRFQLEKINYGPSKAFASRLSGLDKRDRVNAGRNIVPAGQAASVGQAAPRVNLVKATSSFVKLEITNENQIIKEHSISFQP